MSQALIPSDIIISSIVLIRGHKVILDSDLAKLYDVQTRILTRAVRTNLERFPDDFMFQLTDQEWEILRSTFGISNNMRGGRRYNPYVFTEQGVAMLSGLLNSSRAIHVNIEIMRAFVRLREMLLSNADLNHRIDELEKRYDQQFSIVFDAIRQLMTPPDSSTKRIGFQVKE